MMRLAAPHLALQLVRPRLRDVDHGKPHGVAAPLERQQNFQALEEGADGDVVNGEVGHEYAAPACGG